MAPWQTASAPVLAGDLDLALGDERAGDRRAEKINSLVDRVGAEHREDEIAHELLAQIVDVDLLDAELFGLAPRRFQFLALAEVGREGDDVAVVGGLQPFEDDRRVEAARIGEDHLVDVGFVVGDHGGRILACAVVSIGTPEATFVAGRVGCVSAHYRSPARTGNRAGADGAVREDGMNGARIEFWYEFASTYSYLSVMRITEAAAARGVEVVWKPFLLGPIFQAQGWSTSPFNLLPAKGAYMWRDVARQAKARGLAFQAPDPERGPGFPQNGLAAARLALVGHDAGWGAAFAREVFKAQFAHGRDIASEDVLRWSLHRAGADAKATLPLAMGDANKLRLRRQTKEAQERGLFGAPSFTTPSGELFWGDDRLEAALEWAVAEAATESRAHPDI